MVNNDKGWVGIDHGRSWIGVDLDGTLAHYDKWVAWNSIGEPIPLMAARVRKWVDEGRTVKIFTARVAGVGPQRCLVTGATFTPGQMVECISEWCTANVHPNWHPQVTCLKDVHMVELWDDRAVQVIPNTGRTLSEEHAAEISALSGKP